MKSPIKTGLDSLKPPSKIYIKKTQKRIKDIYFTSLGLKQKDVQSSRFCPLKVNYLPGCVRSWLIPF